MPDPITVQPVADPADGHLGLDDLADLAVGEAPEDPAVAAGAAAHLASCAACQAELAQIRADFELSSSSLQALDLAAPEPSGHDMPVTVAARLDRALAEEFEARLDNVRPLRRPAPLKAPATASYVRQTGFFKIMLAAAALAAAVGFGGYVVSASAGMNEPTAIAPVQVHPDGLASQASQLAEDRDLDPHLFSAAWRCARQVIDDRISGITPVYTNGEATYLVYTRSDGVTYARLLSGCTEDAPLAGPPVRVTK